MHGIRVTPVGLTHCRYASRALAATKPPRKLLDSDQHENHNQSHCRLPCLDHGDGVDPREDEGSTSGHAMQVVELSQKIVSVRLVEAASHDHAYLLISDSGQDC